MPLTSATFLASQLELADQLRGGDGTMLEPEDLPGRYGRVIHAVNRLLRAIDATAVLGGGWAVWRHGYIGRVTQDVDIVLPADRVDAFLQTAPLTGFDVLKQPPGRWPKVMHKETGIQVDILPEGERPGTPTRPAPTLLPHPSTIGGEGSSLRYVTLPALITLKLAAGRARDEADVVELIRANPGQAAAVRTVLAAAHPTYAEHFDRLCRLAAEQEER